MDFEKIKKFIVPYKKMFRFGLFFSVFFTAILLCLLAYIIISISWKSFWQNYDIPLILATCLGLIAYSFLFAAWVICFLSQKFVDLIFKNGLESFLIKPLIAFLIFSVAGFIAGILNKLLMIVDWKTPPEIVVIIAIAIFIFLSFFFNKKSLLGILAFANSSIGAFIGLYIGFDVFGEFPSFEVMAAGGAMVYFFSYLAICLSILFLTLPSALYGAFFVFNFVLGPVIAILAFIFKGLKSAFIRVNLNSKNEIFNLEQE